MAVSFFQSQKVRDTLRAPVKLGLDVLVLLVIGAVVGGAITFGRQVTSPMTAKVNIALSLGVLPKYVFFSLSRGMAAYVLSLAFTLIYGTIAAHHHRAERIMIPMLDVLQTIPVLGFLPVVVLSMIQLFPTREIGLELACIVMIFTAQAWNMTFSFHGSLRGIPEPLREVAKIQQLTGWQTFKLLELPSAMIGLVWNSMMSMAGGWFFLSVNEAFSLGTSDYRLPGIGSYIAEAIKQENNRALFAGIVAMTLMIIAVDQILWRPIVVWSQRFKLEDNSDAEKPRSWLLDLLAYSNLWNWLKKRAEKQSTKSPAVAVRKNDRVSHDSKNISDSSNTGRSRSQLWSVATFLLLAAITVGSLWGLLNLIRLLLTLPLRQADGDDWVHVLLALGASFLRTSVCVLLSMIWTLPVGIMIGLSPKWSQRLQPVIQVVASFPAPMLFPLVTLLLVKLHVPFSIGCVSLMMLGAQWYILFNVIAGASAIPADLKEVGEVYNMSRAEKWRKIYLPCVFPHLVTGLVTAAGGAWNASIVSEYLAVRGHVYDAFGLGSTIFKAQAGEKYPLLTAGVVVMAVFVVFLNRFFWKKVFKLAESRYSLNV